MLSPIPEDVVRYAGLVMAQAACIASVLHDGELICPFIVVARGEDRQSIAFEADGREEAVARGWASLDEYRTHVDMWAFVREGLINSAGGKEDVLVVAVWKPGMEAPAIFLQRFLPVAKGGFALIGAVIAEDQPAESLAGIGALFTAGVYDHPKGHLWEDWQESGSRRH